jgi:hypothetical protein
MVDEPIGHPSHLTYKDKLTSTIKINQIGIAKLQDTGGLKNIENFRKVAFVKVYRNK